MIDNEILEKINKAKIEGKKIGLVQGSWDMFHLGHLCYLQEAKKLCDFLIVAMDDDEKIKYRKGNSRPIIPLNERYNMIEKLNIANAIVVKKLGEPKWGLIKAIKPDCLVAIRENYKDEDIKKLEEYCGKVAILPRQATTSTSEIIRRTLIKNGIMTSREKDPRINDAINNFKARIGFHEALEEPITNLIKYLEKSEDWVTPVAACCFYKGIWYFGANKIDRELSQGDIEKRTELFYNTSEHAEINMLKKMGEVEDLSDTPILTTLFPCDQCMKVLIDKGVKEIYYLEDHIERNWSKRSHALADKNGVKTTQVMIQQAFHNNDEECPKDIDFSQYRYIDPRNVRYQKQLEIMLHHEALEQDPLDPNIIDQEILFKKNYWYVSRNRFPYDEIEHQFLIISLNPIYNIHNMPKEMWQELRDIWDILSIQYNIKGGALCYRFGDTLLSGASLKRLHAHIIVPKEKYKTKFTIGGNTEMKKILRHEDNNTSDSKH